MPTINAAIDALVVQPDRSRYDNQFFERYGTGNGAVPSAPYEKFKWYEELLRRIWQRHPAKYPEIHKGTAFYFLGWLGFDLGNYQKGLFYLDAAVSQDKDASTTPNSWQNLPAALFLRLIPNGHAAHTVVTELRRRLEPQLIRFASISGVSLTLDSLALRLAKNLLEKDSERSILSGFYAFAYEYEDRVEELAFRGDAVVGSHESHLMHLFRGGLIFESLAKQHYSESTLGKILNSSQFKNDFNCTGHHFSSNATTLAGIVTQYRGTTGVISQLEAALKVRNCTGHDLVRDAAFIPRADYEFLVERLFDAIFHLLLKKFPE